MKSKKLKETTATTGLRPNEANQANNVSLDQIVDKLLVQYERESSPVAQRLSELKKFIFEEEDLGTDLDSQPAQDIPIPPAKINIASFASMVARLVENRDTLLDPKTVIAARAVLFVRKHYNDTVANEFLSILESQYKLTARPRKEVDGDAPSAPLAAGAAADIGG